MARLNTKSKRWLFATVIFLACIGCDQATKHMATQRLYGAPPQSFLADTVRLQYALNPGAFLSWGGQLSPQLRFYLFGVLNTVLLGVLVCFLATKRTMRTVHVVALACLLAGGIGNLIDRLHQNGMVTDFINLGVGPLRTGIFNVADVAITGSALTLLFVCRNDGANESKE